MSDRSIPAVTIIGGGLAGCEAAWQLSLSGIPSKLYEMRPGKSSPAHETDQLAELVCSNSLRGEGLTGAVGLLKEEMRRAGSLIMAAADATRVPAGGALAVDRDEFSQYIADKIGSSPFIEIVREELTEIPEECVVIIASGPLTSDTLASKIAELTGKKHLYFYDAIAPIVEADSIDMEKVWAASRYDKGEADYLNCPMSEEEYKTFVQALNDGDKVATKDFEQLVHFEGCMPIEEMASRGEMTLAFGPMKPVGLADPKTEREPYAVIQLRQENRHKTLYNLVGFQTRLKYSEQERIFRTIPGLEKAKFSRLGSMHRNTFIHAPTCLNSTLQFNADTRLTFAGQITGVEGYVESTACGFMAGIFVAMQICGVEPVLPTATTACGALLGHLGNTETDNFQPMNINYGLFPPLEGKRLRKRRERRLAMAERGLADIETWIKAITDWRQTCTQSKD